MLSVIKRFKPTAEPPRIIVHVGMHKTGTTSIQDTFYHSTNPAIEYVDWQSSNHSPLFVMLFEDESKFAQYHAFRNRGADFIAELPDLRAKWKHRVEKQIRNAKGKTVIFSAEDSSAPVFETAVEQMHAFFSSLSSDIHVVGYARDPRSFMESAFQQNLKGGVVPDMERRGLRPNYKLRFAKMDRIFGEENVTLKAFHKDRLEHGNVVKDFAQTLGIDMPSDGEIAHSNPRMSLEATALLYVQRKYGQGMVSGFPEAEAANNLFVHRLSQIGQKKLTFADKIMAPLLERIADDVAWMEHRLGHAFDHASDDHVDAVKTMDDLIAIALDSYEDVLEVSQMSKTGSANVETLVDALEHLREASYAECLNAQGT